MFSLCMNRFDPHSVIGGLASCIRRTLSEAKPSWKKLSDEAKTAVWEEFKVIPY